MESFGDALHPFELMIGGFENRICGFLNVLTGTKIKPMAYTELYTGFVGCIIFLASKEKITLEY